MRAPARPIEIRSIAARPADGRTVEARSFDARSGEAGPLADRTSFGRPSAKPKKVLPPPVVRKEPPTIDEAAFAAIGLADELEHQVEIAAGLMGVSSEEARESVLKAKATRPALGMTRPTGHVAVRDRIVTVERTNVRRVVLPPRTGPIRLAR